MSLLLVSFFAGILTVLAPCVLPLLPVILGGTASNKNKWYPYIVIASLGVSIFLFTLLLKATSLLINIPPEFWTSVSGIILVFFGFITLFPRTWDAFNVKLGLSQNSDKLLEQASEVKSGIWQPVLLGAALGPVFSSCSFTYALLLATVLPADFWWGVTNMLVYIAGLTLILLLISVLGSRLIKKLKFASNPDGIFKRGLGLLFLIVGVLIITGYDKKFQVFVADTTKFDITNIEKSVLQQNNITKDNSVSLDSKGVKAEEFVGLQNWINSSPTTLASLKGKVVLVDFWTYSCINCIRTQPYLNTWYDTYKDKNFVIIGIHTPEFSFEKKLENLEKAVKEAKIQYPVASDNDYDTWNTYKNSFWPAKYLIDKEGQIRYTHFGEGAYEETEKAIQTLIAETGTKVDGELKSSKIGSEDNKMALTPETYLGWSRSTANFLNIKNIEYNVPSNYILNTDLKTDNWSLGGNWQINNENIIAKQSGNKLRISYKAKDVFLVMGNTSGGKVKIAVDGNSKLGSDVSNNEINVTDYRLYKLVQNNEYNSNGFIELEFPEGVEANAFTFG